MRHNGAMSERIVKGFADDTQAESTDVAATKVTVTGTTVIGAAGTGAAVTEAGAAAVPAPVNPGEVTAQFDHLATRDVTAMEQANQAPQYAGAPATPTLSSTAIAGAFAGADVYGPTASVAVAREENLRPLNPDYTPPSQVAPPHVPEASGLRENEVLDNELNAQDKLR